MLNNADITAPYAILTAERAAMFPHVGAFASDATTVTMIYKDFGLVQPDLQFFALLQGPIGIWFVLFMTMSLFYISRLFFKVNGNNITKKWKLILYIRLKVLFWFWIGFMLSAL